jgi:hypothetical protein
MLGINEEEVVAAMTGEADEEASEGAEASSQAEEEVASAPDVSNK